MQQLIDKERRGADQVNSPSTALSSNSNKSGQTGRNNNNQNYKDDGSNGNTNNGSIMSGGKVPKLSPLERQMKILKYKEKRKKQK